ncbi:hypothetical protein [Rhodovulum sp. P5]|uniref:hypothetical protein n=1 Tax=Rhodovulum sp. P5 TaxID=1564506 RepID=UPI0020A4FC55|nr:hypothetical protein [Rhodovulum sp. P5]
MPQHILNAIGKLNRAGFEIDQPFAGARSFPRDGHITRPIELNQRRDGLSLLNDRCQETAAEVPAGIPAQGNRRVGLRASDAFQRGREFTEKRPPDIVQRAANIGADPGTSCCGVEIDEVTRQRQKDGGTGAFAMHGLERLNDLVHRTKALVTRPCHRTRILCVK